MRLSPETRVKAQSAPTAAWKGVGPLTESALAAEEARLVAERGSMTRFIEEVSGLEVTISVLRQKATTPMTDEEFFASGAMHGFKCREVCLSCDGVPMLVARSVWLESDTVVDKALSRLGKTSLGQLLFGEEHYAAVSLREVAHLPAGHPLYELVAIAAPSTPFSPALVARRSRYWICDQPLILTEVFLPALKELVKMHLERAQASGNLN